MSDFISENNTTIDTYFEHDLHTETDKHCSVCHAISCGKGTMYPETCAMIPKCKMCDDNATRNDLCLRCWGDLEVENLDTDCDEK